MKTVCYYCDGDFELDSDDISIELESDHPYIVVIIRVRCPHCQEVESIITTLNEFLQERGVED